MHAKTGTVAQPGAVKARGAARQGLIGAAFSLGTLGLGAVCGEAALAYVGIKIARKLNPRPYLLTHLLAAGSLAHGLVTLTAASRVVSAAMPDRDFRWPLRVLGLSVSGLVAYAYYVEPRWIETPRIEIRLAGLAPALDGLRIVLISDPHAGPHFGSREMERVVAASNGLRPDVVALLGDFVARFPVDMPVVTRGIADLVAPLGVFAVLGNHDYWIDGAAIERALVKAGVRLLKNSGLPFERGGGRFWLAGLDDMRWGRPNLDAALDGALDGEVVILLVHNPIGVRAAAARGVPLVLSGHTHGGQIRIPGVGPLMLPIRERHFAQGRVQVGPTQLYVNRGVGVGTPPVRLGVRPEVTLIVPRTA